MGAQMTARHASKCPACPDPIEEGSIIEQFGTEWLHSKCATKAAIEKHRDPRR